MRPIETLLLLANLLAFSGLLLPLPRALQWMRHSAPVALLAAGAQILAEGPRWQMTPAYALAGLLFLVWLWRIAATKRTVRGRTHRLATGTAVGAHGRSSQQILHRDRGPRRGGDHRRRFAGLERRPWLTPTSITPTGRSATI